MKGIGIAGIGIYIPEGRMSAAEISAKTQGVWSEEAVRQKLGIVEKSIPGPADGTQEMAVKAAKAAMDDAGISGDEIDLVLSMGEEWKEYPLTTSALYVQGAIGAKNAWGIDVQNRCSTTVSAIKMAKDMMLGDKDLNTVLIAGGYRNGDFLDYEDNLASMMFNLSAGGGALVLKKGMTKNLVLGSHIIGDGSMSRDAGVKYGGINNPITAENADYAYKTLTLFRPKEMKDKLNATSMDNWMTCINMALEKSDLSQKDIDYLGILHIKRSMHTYMLNALGLEEDQSIYLENYGHVGQIDQILSLKLGLEQGKVKDGDVVLLIAAGIGYVWGANVIRWGGM